MAKSEWTMTLCDPLIFQSSNSANSTEGSCPRMLSAGLRISRCRPWGQTRLMLGEARSCQTW